MIFRNFIFILFLTLVTCPIASETQASTLCDFYKKFMPHIYKANCNGSRTVKPEASGATFADSFSVNPASIPTEQTPYGIESLNSYLRNQTSTWSPTFSVIKGFQKFGAGVSTAGSNTFYSNDVVRRMRSTSILNSFDPLEPAKSKFPNLSLGTSFSLASKTDNKSGGLSLGLTGRFNRVTRTLGGGFGLILRKDFFNIGVGITREKVSNLANAAYFQSGFISTRIFFLELEYTVLKSYGSFNLPPIQIGTATLNFGPLMASAAVRKAYYVQEGNVVQRHYAIQAFPSKSFSIGFLFNYIPGTNSLAGQLYF